MNARLKNILFGTPLPLPQTDRLERTARVLKLVDHRPRLSAVPSLEARQKLIAAEKKP